MAQLAIKGHATRGKEVIELLEMLGGKNINRVSGDMVEYVYIINHSYEGEIDVLYAVSNVYRVFTLEEFLEKFPYKVGDKILYKTYGIYSKIKTMLWNVEKEQVFYRLESNKLFVATADELKTYKEETMEKQAIPPYMDYDVRTEETMEIKIDIPKGYEFAGVDDNAQQVVFTKIQPKYPKTYEECCKVLGKTNSIFFEGLGLEEVNRIKPFIQLLRCRDAYWKNAGEQMGLGKPWKPDYIEGVVNTYYTIHLFNNKLFCAGPSHRNAILSFPNAEMRDAFKENFDDDIEFCKEFL